MDKFRLYKIKQAIRWIIQKDRIGIILGILGFLCTVIALIYAEKSSNENYKLAYNQFRLQQLDHYNDSVSDYKKDSENLVHYKERTQKEDNIFKYQDSINKITLNTLKQQNNISKDQLLFQENLYNKQVILDEPQLSLDIEKVENKNVIFNIYNDGKRDALLEDYEFFMLRLQPDTLLSVDTNNGYTTLHPGQHINFYTLDKQLKLYADKQCYISFKVNFTDQFLKKQKVQILIYGLRLTTTNETYKAELLAPSSNQVKRVQSYILKIPPHPRNSN